MAAAALLEEEENYVRMSLLLTGISPRAARTLFDSEFAPTCLEASIKKNYNLLADLKSKHRINLSQWNLLFPRYPDVPDSKTFDITLMITLLRNLTTMIPPAGGYDQLPATTETTSSADLARMKYYRNYLAHLDDGRIDITFFNTAWVDISGAIDRLSGGIMKKECDHLKTKPLDQTNQEIMLEIKHSNDEIGELKGSLENLKLSHKEMKKTHELLQKDYDEEKRVHSLLKEDHEEVKKSHALLQQKVEIYQQDTVPWNVRAQIKKDLEKWKKKEKMFVNTRAALQVLNAIQKNSCVTITASFGMGKTAILQCVASQMGTDGYDILLVTDPGDIVKFYNPNKKTMFVIDDFCGNFSLSRTDIKIWEPVIERIKEILQDKQTKIIVACRLQVYQDKRFDTLSIFKSCVCNLLSDSMRLLKTEKQLIAERYLKAKACQITDYYDLFDCFVLLCKFYHEHPTLDIKYFFQNPFSVYEAQVDQLYQNGFLGKFCALALCVVFNNKVMDEIFTDDIGEETRIVIENTCEACKLDRGTSRFYLKDEMDSLLHTFFKKKDRPYNFREHQSFYTTLCDKIFDFLVKYFGLRITGCLIKNADSCLIRERFLLEKSYDMDQFIIVLPYTYHEIYMQRIINDWSKGKLQDVFNNNNMKSENFRQILLSFLNGLDKSYQKQLVNTRDVDCKTPFCDYNVVCDTVMLHCCAIGDMKMIQWCWNRGIRVNHCGYLGESPLTIACRYGHKDIVRMLFNRGADYNKSSTNGRSPLMTACKQGHTEIVKMLLDKRAKYEDIFDIFGLSPVMLACENGDSGTLKMLLDNGADYNKGSEDFSLLLTKVSKNEVKRTMVINGLGKCYNAGTSPVMIACIWGHTEIVRMLIDKGAYVNNCDYKGKSLVLTASEWGHKEIVMMLLDEGANFNKCDSFNQSPILIACSQGHTELVKMFLERGADYDMCDHSGWSPVLKACSIGHTDIVSMLLDIGADYNKCNNLKQSPIMMACTHGHTEIVKVLLDKKADYHMCNNDGQSPIWIASSDGRIEIVRMLLDKGAYYNMCDKNGRSPLMMACCRGYAEIVKILLDKGADFHNCGNDGMTPIMKACMFGRKEIVNTLLDKGAKYNAGNNDGQSPIMIACRYGYTGNRRMLATRAPRNTNNETIWISHLK